MTTYFTSDTHLGHKNIISLCHRPFVDTDEMDEDIIGNWNSIVRPEDTVFHLGDVAMGSIAESLPKIGRMNGYKILVVGNHDRLFNTYSKTHQAKFAPEYEKVFDEVWGENGGAVRFAGTDLNVSHFPYDGDSHDADRFSSSRRVDKGIPLIHGHTHSSERVSYSSKGTLQIHVGVDAWDFRPVHVSDVLHLLDTASPVV